MNVHGSFSIKATRRRRGTKTLLLGRSFTDTSKREEENESGKTYRARTCRSTLLSPRLLITRHVCQILRFGQDDMQRQSPAQGLLSSQSHKSQWRAYYSRLR